MIIQLDANINAPHLDNIRAEIQACGYKATEVNTQKQHYLVAIGKQEFDLRRIGQLPGVRDVHRVSDAYKLVSKKWKVGSTHIHLGDDVKIGPNHFGIMAGPCSIESPEQVNKVLDHLNAQGVSIMRGGAYKPRTSPYSFQGVGIDGLKMWHDLAKPKGIKIISEVLAVHQIQPMYDYVDIYQVGARNAQNFALLHELGKVDKPVMIKRGMSGTIEDLLQSAEYVFSSGNERLLLCERGIRTYEDAYRNTLDLNAVPILKEKTHLPVIVDPSHGIGIRRFVKPMALAGIMAGCDGLIFEVHETPEEAFSDGQQTLNFSESTELINTIRKAYAFRQENDL